MLGKMEEIHKYLNRGPRIHVHEYRIYSNHNWPEKCPWGALNGAFTENLINKVFAQLVERLPQTITSLKRNCENVLCYWTTINGT